MGADSMLEGSIVSNLPNFSEKEKVVCYFDA